LLAGQGFKEIYNLSGGIKAWQGLTAVGPAELATISLRGDETPVEIISLAYGMEEGLRSFYAIIAKRMQDPAVTSVLTKLEGIEVIHKNRLFNRYLSLTSDPKEQGAFESQVVSTVMEGGFTTEQYIEQNRHFLKSVGDVLSLAMMLETQSLDLYMRCAQRNTYDRSRTVLHGLAEEEKTHLGTLGRLIEARA